MTVYGCYLGNMFTGCRLVLADTVSCVCRTKVAKEREALVSYKHWAGGFRLTAVRFLQRSSHGILFCKHALSRACRGIPHWSLTRQFVACHRVMLPVSKASVRCQKFQPARSCWDRARTGSAPLFLDQYKRKRTRSSACFSLLLHSLQSLLILQYALTCFNKSRYTRGVVRSPGKHGTSN